MKCCFHNPTLALYLSITGDEEAIVKRPEEEALNDEDLSPVMDSMYQVAIEEMVDKVPPPIQELLPNNNTNP